MATKGKEQSKKTSVKSGSKESVGKVTPGTIEVTARIMGEDGEWIERTIQVNSGVSVGTFDITSRNGYLACFNTLEQAMIDARNEASREMTELFLKLLEKLKRGSFQFLFL